MTKNIKTNDKSASVIASENCVPTVETNDHIIMRITMITTLFEGGR